MICKTITIQELADSMVAHYSKLRDGIECDETHPGFGDPQAWILADIEKEIQIQMDNIAALEIARTML